MPASHDAAIDRYGFADVLSLEAMLDDPREWANPAWRARFGLLDSLR